MKSFNMLKPHEQKALEICDNLLFKVISNYTCYINDYSILSRSEMLLLNYMNGVIILSDEFLESVEHLTKQMPPYSTLSDYDKNTLKICAFAMHHVLSENNATQDNSPLNDSYECLFKYIDG